MSFRNTLEQKSIRRKERDARKANPITIFHEPGKNTVRPLTITKKSKWLGHTDKAGNQKYTKVLIKV